MRCLITLLLAGALFVGVSGIHAAEPAPVPSRNAEARRFKENVDKFIASLTSKIKSLTSKGWIPVQLVKMQSCATAPMEEMGYRKNDYRTPILGGIREDAPPPPCENPPTDDYVLRVLPRSKGIPHLYENFRDDVQIVSELLIDKIDPPRFFPLVGPSQLHHCQWKCTVYYTEVVELTYPLPIRMSRPRVQVVYIDKDHLHVYPCATPEINRGITRDLSQQ
jgi:hypothetical protein